MNEKNWPSKKDLLLLLSDGDKEILNYPYDYGKMNNKHPYILQWYAGLQAGCFSIDEEGLSEYILDKTINGDDSYFEIYDKDLKEISFKLNVTVELKEK